jgi:hypothetical protein
MMGTSPFRMSNPGRSAGAFVLINRRSKPTLETASQEE